MNSIRGMLFDLDGTLLDSAPDLVAALNRLRSFVGLSALDIREMSPHVSRGAAGLIKAGMPVVDQRQFEAWKTKFLAYYAENYFEHSRLYEGVQELLQFLDQAGIPWGIVTNKMESLTLPILRAAGIFDDASCVVCGDTLNTSKPDPAPVVLACRILQVPLNSTIFAGDHIHDLQAGRAAGTLTAVVHYGYGVYEPDDELVVKSLQINHPVDLINIVKARCA